MSTVLSNFSLADWLALFTLQLLLLLDLLQADHLRLKTTISGILQASETILHV